MTSPSELPPSELRRAVVACRGPLAAAALFSMAANLLFLSSPLFSLQIYDRVLKSGSKPTLVVLAVMLLVALATLAVLDGVRHRVLARAGLRFDRLLSHRVLSAALERRAQGDERHGQMLRELDTVRQAITGSAALALFDALWIPVFAVVAALIHPLFGLVTVAGAVLLAGLAVAGELMTRHRLEQAAARSLSVHLGADGALRHAEAIQAMGLHTGLLRRWLGERTVALGLQTRAGDRAGDMASLIKACRLGLQSAVIAVGAWLVLDQAVTPGAMFAAALVLGRGLSPIEQLIGAWRGVAAALPAWHRLSALLNTAPAPLAITLPPQPTGHLSAERLSFSPAGGRTVLRAVSFAVAPGEVLGVVGPSAAGKSTLARLLLGLWRPTGGSVRLDGAELATWPRHDLGRHIGYLPQEVALLAGSVRNNIARFGNGDDEAVFAAARLAGVHEMILRLPQGYDTPLGEGGLMLSGGQRQRLALARALFGAPALVVLDEPNASLDADGEQALLRAVKAVKRRGATVVVIAHRAAVLAAADRILMLRDGHMEFLGSRAEAAARLAPPPVPSAAPVARVA